MRQAPEDEADTPLGLAAQACPKTLGRWNSAPVSVQGLMSSWMNSKVNEHKNTDYLNLSFYGLDFTLR